MDKTDDKREREENTMNSSNSIKTKDMAYIALCAVLLAVCSWISIPFTVPFTLQTFAVFCTLLILGGKRGTIAVAVYILMAAVGLPVLSGFRGGAGALLGTTGGYILGFILTGLIYWLSEKVLADSPVIRIAALVCGLAVCYAFGTVWFMYVYARNTGPVALGTALSWCVIPFIIPDLAKLLLAVVISGRVKKLIRF